MRSLPMLKCSRLRWVWAPQYLLAGTSTSPRLSNSRRIPLASRPMGRSRIFGAVSSVLCGETDDRCVDAFSMCVSFVIGWSPLLMFDSLLQLWVFRLPHRILYLLNHVGEFHTCQFFGGCGLRHLNGNRGGDAAQIVNVWQEGRSGLFGIHLICDGFGSGGEHAIADLARASNDRAQTQTGIEQRVVGLSDHVRNAFISDGVRRNA